MLGELRLLAATEFDSRLSVVLAGDARLTDKLQRNDLQPLESRPTLGHELTQGTRCLPPSRLATPGRRASRTLFTLPETTAPSLADSLLAAAAERTELDERLFFEIFTPDKRRGARTFFPPADLRSYNRKSGAGSSNSCGRRSASANRSAPSWPSPLPSRPARLACDASPPRVSCRSPPKKPPTRAP